MKTTLPILLTLLLAACGSETTLPSDPVAPPPPPPPPQPPPPAPSVTWLALVSGNDQRAFPGSVLSAPLVVKAMDRLGNGVPGVPVTWATTLGQGEALLEDGVPVPAGGTVTGSDGMTRVFFRPGGSNAGRNTITASVGEPTVPPVTFTITLLSLSNPVTIPFGPLFDCGEPSLFVELATPIPLGSAVEWQYVTWPGFFCTARIVSLSVPPGGEAFDSGILEPGQSFHFTPKVTGDWVYVEAIFGGSGVLRVR